MTAVTSQGQAAQAPSGEDVLRVEHISKRFGAVTALRDINLHLKRGEVLALLGDNGAGKSTLIKIICGFQQPDGGRIVVDVQAASITAAQDRATAVSVARPRGNATASPRVDGMTVILPHATEWNGRQAVLPSALRRSASARRYSSMTISLSSVTEVSLLGLSKVISPCCSRLIRSEISSTWP